MVGQFWSWIHGNDIETGTVQRLDVCDDWCVFLLGASTRKEVKTRFKTLTRIDSASDSVSGRLSPLLIASLANLSHPFLFSQHVVLFIWAIWMCFRISYWKAPLITQTVQTVSTNATAFQGTHNRRFSGRSWNSPTNFAASDLSSVPTLSTFGV